LSYSLYRDLMQHPPASVLGPDRPAAHAAAPLPWRIEEIDLSAIDIARVRGDDTLFFMLTTAAFVEITSNVYTRNLSDYYADDPDLLAWLNQSWEQEEIQHGRALRDYVRAVWPERDWDGANAAFFAEYSARCTLDEFEPSQALEMAARCVVETGTASFYRMLHEYIDEPVLKRITAHIRADEVRHYSYFLHFFSKYADRDLPSRWQVARAVARRVAEAADDDALIAFRHAFRMRYPQRPFQRGEYDAYQARLRGIMRRHFPNEMAVKMLLKPVRLPPRLQRLLTPALSRLSMLAFV
jgi:rubrerythrin